jgi:hypothetical protein
LARRIVTLRSAAATDGDEEGKREDAGDLLHGESLSCGIIGMATTRKTFIECMRASRLHELLTISDDALVAMR